MRFIILTAILLTSLLSCGQNYGARTILGREFAEVELEQSLTEKSLHNVIDNMQEIISDSTTAVAIAETILFKTLARKILKINDPMKFIK